MSYRLQIKYNKVLFVDGVNGDDAIAALVLNDFNFPFQTIAAAVTAAVGGNLIYIRPASYSVTTNILIDGINFEAEKGVFISSSVVMLNADTTAGGTTMTKRFQFLGHANISSTQPICVIRTNPSAIIDLYAAPYTCTNNSNGMVIRDGTFNLYIDGDYNCGGRNFRMQDTGNLNAFIQGICYSNTGNNANAVFYSTNTYNWSGTANITARSFVLTASAASEPYIHLANATGCNLNINLEYVTDAGAVTYPFMECLDFTTTNSNVNINIGEISLTNRPLFSVSDADHDLNINMTRGTAKGGSISSGNLTINNTKLVTTATLALGGGTLNILNTTVDTSGSAAVIPVTITTGILNTFSSKYVTDGTAVPISNIGGTFNSESSRSTVFPTGIVFGDFYVQGVRYENTQTHTAGATVTVSNNITVLYVDPASVLAALDITMPSAPLNNQELMITFGGQISTTGDQVVTALGLVGNAGQTILSGDSINIALVGLGLRLKWRSSDNTWRLL